MGSRGSRGTGGGGPGGARAAKAAERSGIVSDKMIEQLLEDHGSSGAGTPLLSRAMRSIEEFRDGEIRTNDEAAKAFGIRTMPTSADMATTKALYAETQAWLKSKGIKEVTAFRGDVVSGSVASKMKVGDVVKIPNATPFSEKAGVADRYVIESMGDGKTAVIFRGAIPASKIVAHYGSRNVGMAGSDRELAVGGFGMKIKRITKSSRNFENADGDLIRGMQYVVDFE